MTSTSVPAAQPPLTVRSVLVSRQLRRLLIAHGSGTVAQQLLVLAVGVAAFHRTGSGIWTSATVALGFAPYALLSGVAGTVADRYSRSQVIAWSSGARLVVTAVLTAGLVLNWPVPALLALAAATAVLATPAYPAVAAAAPECVEDCRLPAANALVTGVENVCWVAGPGVFGLAVLFGAGPAGATVTAAALFALALAASAPVRLPPPDLPPERGWVGSVAAGVLAVTGDRRIALPMMVAVASNLLYGYLVVTIILIGSRGDSSGHLNAAMAVGAVVAIAATGSLGRTARLEVVLGVVMGGFCAAAVVLVLAGSTFVGIAAAAAAGSATLALEVVAVTMLQQAAPREVTAGVFGVYDQLAVTAIALGSLVAGPLTAALGAVWGTTFVAAGCAAVTTVLVAVMAHRG